MIELERPRDATRGCDSKLQRVIEPNALGWEVIDQHAEHLVCKREGSNKLASVQSHILRSSKRRGKRIAWMARLVFAHVVIHEIEIPDKCAVIQRRRKRV